MNFYRHDVAPSRVIIKLFVQTAVNVIPRLLLSFMNNPWPFIEQLHMVNETNKCT
jgi:hypothetical protein